MVCISCVVCDECDLYDYLNFRTVHIADTDISNMNFVYKDNDQITYFSICNALDESIVAQSNLSTDSTYNIITCTVDKCYGLSQSDMVTALPLIDGRGSNTVRLIYKHPIDDLPLIISFPDRRIELDGVSLNNSVIYERIFDNKDEYEPAEYHNYSIRVKEKPDIKIVDTYIFGTQYYVNSWIWAVVGVSFMLSSACFHNFVTTSGKLSSFTYFIYFYTGYRLMDTFYCVFYTPSLLIASTSVIIFPGAIAYVLTHLDDMRYNYYALCKV